ncbi:MAG: T9SS type A sorting domain-containing protein, partial [Ignavibacteria bacterium]
VRHPTNQNIMFGGANTTASGIFGQGGYVTTDGGVTWTGTNLLPPFTQNSSDPGPTIDKNGNIIFTVLDSPGIVAAYSTNNGTSWSGRVTINSGSEDKNFAGTDDAPSSTFYGRSYCVWSHFTAVPPIVISYTTNGGISWSGMSQINAPPGGHYSQGADIVTGPNGEVYVSWAAPVQSGSFTEDFAGFAKSTNGGASWTVTENAYDMNGIRAGTFNGWNFRVNGFPRIGIDRSGGSRNGWIYIVASEVNLAPAGTDADVVLHRSTDGGTTWSPGIRVNQDPLSNGKVQFFPAIRVDEAGNVNICYYDNRNYPSVGDSCETYLSQSSDGGTTWTDVLVSDHRWKVKGEAGLGNYGGDYIGISSGNGKVWPFWFDDKTGTMQAWTCEVSQLLVGVSGNNNETPGSFELKQNFPNPFNPSTIINYSVPKEGEISLEVFDISGRMISTLVNEVKQAGNYKYDFNAGSLSTGVYFYKLTGDGFTSTRKMILVK